MRILLITQGISPVVVPIFRSAHELVGVAEDGPRIPRTGIQKGIGLIMSAMNNKNSLSYFCKINNLPYFYIKNIQETPFKNWVLTQKPDLIVVYSMSHLLKKSIISIPKFGAINLHPSYLPQYRGPNPYIWMYHNFDKTGGVTVHYIDEGEDTGDIIFQKKIPIPLGCRLDQFKNYLIGEIGINLILAAMDQIEKGSAPRIPQSKGNDTNRARNLLKGEEKTLIDWMTWDVKHVWHMVKGYSEFFDFIGYVDRPPIGYKTIVQKYIECPVKLGDRGAIQVNSDGIRYIMCSNGKIFYQFRFILFRRLQKIIRCYLSG